MTGSFDADGYAMLPALAAETLLESAGAALAERAVVGARDLLHEAWCADLARTGGRWNTLALRQLCQRFQPGGS
jgi:hypothetical protein